MSKRKKPYWIEYRPNWHKTFVTRGVWSEWTWINRYKTQKAQSEALRNMKSKEHEIIDFNGNKERI